ncbi:Hypothetical protein GLP15_4330 [Giardia lamblia P15]|uniref:Uncharacterized protein n=1 Tax=Giardia intestinalis (strain P15) TaxID=658858 RepID=E1EWY2_GIAIA|nr:Hypothetical protein GLP15_4330 [Giardia lamblia P15]
MSKFSMYEEPREDALYEVVSSDRYSVSRRLTTDIVDSQLASAARNITRRLRTLGVMYTINFTNPTERNYYDIADAFIKVIDMAESNDVRIRQDFISLKNKYETLSAQIAARENENAQLKEEIRTLQKTLSTEREERKVELRNTARAVKNAEYKAVAAEKLRTVAEKNNSKLKDMLQNSRTFSVTKSYGAPLNKSQNANNLANSRMDKSMGKSTLGRSMSVGASSSGYTNSNGSARPRNAVFSPRHSFSERMQDTYREYERSYNDGPSSTRFSCYDESLRPPDDRIRSNESFIPYDPVSMVQESQPYSESLRPYQSLKPPKCPSLRESDVPADYALSSAQSISRSKVRGQDGHWSAAQSPGSVRYQQPYDENYALEDIRGSFSHSDLGGVRTIEHRPRDSASSVSFSQSPQEPALMSVGDCIKRYHSGVSGASQTPESTRRSRSNSVDYTIPKETADHIADLELNAKKEKLEKMQNQIAEAVNILNRAGITVDVNRRDLRAPQYS